MITEQNRQEYRAQFVKAKRGASEDTIRAKEARLIAATIVLFTMGSALVLSILGDGISGSADMLGVALGLGLTGGAFFCANKFHHARDYARTSYKKAKANYQAFRLTGVQV